MEGIGTFTYAEGDRYVGYEFRRKLCIQFTNNETATPTGGGKVGNTKGMAFSVGQMETTSLGNGLRMTETVEGCTSINTEESLMGISEMMTGTERALFTGLMDQDLKDGSKPNTTTKMVTHFFFFLSPFFFCKKPNLRWVSGGRKGRGTFWNPDGTSVIQDWDEPPNTNYSDAIPPKHPPL
jgi:hypothetical protein